MSDTNLLVVGCGVSFIALAGAYVYIRERFESRFPKDHEGDTDGPRKAA